MGTDKGHVRVLFSEFSTALAGLEDREERNRITEYLLRNSAAFRMPGITKTVGGVEGTVNIEREILEKLKARHPKFYSNLVEAHGGVRPKELKLGVIKARIKEVRIPTKIVEEYTLPEFVRKRLGAQKKKR